LTTKSCWLPGVAAAFVDPVTSVALTADRSTPWNRYNGDVMFAAMAEGGTGNYEYRFLVKNSMSSVWTIAKEYSTDSTFWWNAGDIMRWPAGIYTIKAVARSVGSGTEYDAVKTMNFAVTDVEPAKAVTITMDQKSPVVIGTPVLITANASDGTGNYEYQFLIQNKADGVWTVVRSYDTMNQLTWYPNTAGNYLVRVLARSVGAGGGHARNRAGREQALWFRGGNLVAKVAG